MIPQLLGLMREVVGIHTDAVAAYQARAEGEEVPFRASGAEHVEGVYPHAVEYYRELVHEGYVDVSLGVLYYLAASATLMVGALWSPASTTSP
ncbi:hypothetical protein EVA_14716 [gut metagenome]|uniref:Uncharacterized protein n=1 Tax=gut metagenome TaxID=749906 RepID=J9FQF8_9ZZZZ